MLTQSCASSFSWIVPKPSLKGERGDVSLFTLRAPLPHDFGSLTPGSICWIHWCGKDEVNSRI